MDFFRVLSSMEFNMIHDKSRGRPQHLHNSHFGWYFGHPFFTFSPIFVYLSILWPLPNYRKRVNICLLFFCHRCLVSDLFYLTISVNFIPTLYQSPIICLCRWKNRKPIESWFHGHCLNGNQAKERENLEVVGEMMVGRLNQFLCIN